jgi:hypothetical protein
MNLRIRELAEQTHLIDTIREHHNEFGSGDVDYSELEKFAELIVRKCIESTLNLHDTAIDNEWNLDETFHIIVDDMVEQFDMQHIFRVEE